MSKFKPTYLYVKQHNQTGLKYFGKTTRDPLLYKGSGLYWKNHLKVHGDDITTVWFMLFENEQTLTAYANKFSLDHNIADSVEWANLKPENGLDGFTQDPKYNVGSKRPNLSEYNLRPEVIAKRKENNKGNDYAKALKGYKQSSDHVEKRMKAHRGIKKGPQSEAHIKSRFQKKHCVHCEGKFTPVNFSRWHGDKCKQKM
jgi:hypothetical protein